MRDQITGIVTTVARREAFGEFLRSWEDYSRGERLVIVDQSEEGYCFSAHGGYRVVRGRYGDGVSSAYQQGLDAVDTAYYAFLEDDFRLAPETDLLQLARAVAITEFDIVGGALQKRDLRDRFNVQAVRCNYIWRPPGELHVEPVQESPGYELTPCSFITNFYVADTAKVRAAGGWDPLQQTCAHLDFYCRMQAGGVKVAGSRLTWAWHHKVNDCAEYHEVRRGQMAAMRQRFLETWKIDRVTGVGAW